jgi:ATP-binding cassette subfamily B protein
MHDFCRYAQSPLAFVARYVALRPVAHAAIVIAVLAAVACSVGAQYGVKILVDTLTGGMSAVQGVWWGFLLLVSLIAADNLLWRVASWIANSAFVGVTGDLRRDLFRHLTGHAPSYFAERMPGTLTSRITATSNAVFTLENMFMWNVSPPCVATLVAIAFVATVSASMALASLPQADRCITNSRTGRRPLTAKWWMSSAIYRWFGHFAALAASTSASTQRSNAK